MERAAPAYGDDWWFTGLLAFVRQEQGRFDEAMELSCRSLAEEPGAGHSAHARAHAHYETGDHEAGLAWMDGWVTGDGSGVDSLSHFSWHAALHELSLGDLDAVRRRYDAQLRPELGLGCRALVDSGSLLFRWALTPGADEVPDIRRVAEVAGPDVLERPATPFLALHSAVVLLALGDEARLRALAARAAGPHAPDPARRGRPARRCPGRDGGRRAARSRRDRLALLTGRRCDGSAVRTRSARSSRRPGSPPSSAPGATPMPAGCSTPASTGGAPRATSAGGAPSSRDVPARPGSAEPDRRQARLMSLPLTSRTSGSPVVAGPLTTDPSSMENLLPWQGQLMVPPSTAADRAALVGADRREALEVALVGLGHDDLLVREDRAAADLDLVGRGQRSAPTDPGRRSRTTRRSPCRSHCPRRPRAGVRRARRWRRR